MPADDLRERIREGDLNALTDPALPLLLLADGPTVEWWDRGSTECSKALAHHLISLLQDEDAATAAAWNDLLSGGWLGLALRLRGLLPSAPPEVDAALAVLERYAGG